MKQSWKKLVAVLLTVTMLGALGGCGQEAAAPADGDSAKDAPKTESTPDAAENDNADAKAGEESQSDSIKVGYSLKTVQEERWQRELDGCEAAAKDLNVELIYQVANGDAQTQVSQIENLITQGVDVIMVTAVDAGALTNILNTAKEDGIKILVYDQQLENTYGDAFVGYDDFTNGTLIAQELKNLDIKGNVVLLHGDKSSGIEKIIDGEKSILDQLDVEIVMEQYCQNWGAEAALGYAQNALAEQNNDIAAFVCMNDGIASGTIQALEEVGMDGKVAVTGMDCELTAVQRIAKGTQTSTLYKDSVALSRAAIETAVKLAKGEAVTTESTINFGVNDMPHVIVNSAVITKDNIDSELIDTGYYTKEEVYAE
ncbi:substrate-binding domain-containing protein [Diplocloster agilis]|uniref:substrate-binding domain-containing protein n=1 Tax=Diplocloster agilis TaxID=2850323 RepID=UPI0008205571|nr:substrate-binding domain-containing protein [Suonthocola fibrivorans]MCU6732571.1 substrate-binding domain-containing protein [Suonthocola fibrivorans]SCI53392.1 D-xylose-binding periplasmic protein precursor [uncultured Clostridium sp.]